MESKMKNIIILAHSPITESCVEENTLFYTQWGISEIESEQEKDDLVSKYACREIYGFYNVFVSMRRRVKIQKNCAYDNEIFLDWNILDFSPNQFEAAKMWDTAYRNAKSLHPLHNRIVKWFENIAQAKLEFVELNKKITPAGFFKDIPLYVEYGERYQAELKKRKLFSKVEKGLVDEKILDEIKKPLKEAYNQEYASIIKRIEELENQIKSLEEEE